MTETETYALYTPTIRRATAKTICRDSPLPSIAVAGTGGGTLRSNRNTLFAPLQTDERASDGILAGLAVLTLPVVAYSFMQLWSLMAGGSLAHAVRAFFP